MATKHPGFLSTRIDPDVVLMICTAGHVDHGKTQLVRLLTGCETDRLKTEKERGLTIDLGFAPCFLGGNLCAGIVDVPGHEKFVRNMTAGVSGIDCTILVIAADDGVMPQTVEHFQIMDLLGVRRGMVALTKIDLVDPPTVDRRVEEIREFLRGTFLDGAPICPLSSETFAGFEAFYKTLVDQTRGIARQRAAGVFRMPVERSFAQEGFGAVATGLPVQGAVRVGDELEAVPGGQRARVRSIQRFKRQADEGGRGQCLALNLPEMGKNPLTRGQVLCRPGWLRPLRHFHVRIRAVSPLEHPLRNAELVKFYTGTLEAAGHLHLLESKTLEAGREGLATISLADDAAAAPFDRFIVRRSSPAETIGGGEILWATAGEQRPRTTHALERLRAIRAAMDGLDPFGPDGLAARMKLHFALEQPDGGSRDEAARSLLLLPGEADELLKILRDRGDVLALGSDFYVHAGECRRRRDEIAARVRAASESGGAVSLNLSELRSQHAWPAPLWRWIENDLERAGIIRREGGKAALPDAAARLDSASRQLMERIYRAFEEGAFQTPRPEELPSRLRASGDAIQRLLELLCLEKRLVRLPNQVILTFNHLKWAQDRAVRIMRERGALESWDFKNEIHSSRKYALAILDYLDAQRVTVNINNTRRLAPDYQKRLV